MMLMTEMADRNGIFFCLISRPVASKTILERSELDMPIIATESGSARASRMLAVARFWSR